MNDKPSPILFDGESARQLELFDERPLRILTAFLTCFNSDGEQVYDVPQHVLEALAERFRAVIGPDASTNSIDQAFGGRIARQRNSLIQDDLNAETAFEVAVGKRAAGQVPRARRAGSPFEEGVAAAAERLGVSDEAIRSRYKNTR